MTDGILYKAVPMPDGRKARVAWDARTGKILDVQALPEKKLRYKARKRRSRV